MSKRLIKVAKELNVGTGTIVETLNKKGFDIQNKPTAKVSEEMFKVLAKEFSNSIAIKEKADQLTIGTRTKKEVAEPVSNENEVDSPVKKKKEIKVDLDALVKQTKDKVAAKKQREKEEAAKAKIAAEKARKDAEAKAKAKKAAAEKAKREAEAKAKRDAANKAKKDAEVKAKAPRGKNPAHKTPKANTPKPTTPKVVPTNTTPTPPKTEEKPKTEPKKKVGEDMIRAKTPTLKGLKILGKIDPNKFKKKPPKKEERKSERGKVKLSGPKVVGKIDLKDDKKDSNDPNKRRKRRRKKITRTTDGKTTTSTSTNKDGTASKEGTDKTKTATTGTRTGTRSTGTRSTGARGRSTGARGRSTGARGGSRRGSSRRGPVKKDEPKEVSQKEIQDQIKATMARMAGGGKNKRQKTRRNNRERHREKEEKKEAEKEITNLQLTEFVTVSELANLMDVELGDVMVTCMNLGVIVSINQRLDAEIIQFVAEEFGHTVEFISAEEQLESEEEEIIDDPKDLIPRAPIVTVMGHVDHGKTSLLDYIRQANVIGGEAGGITQHIGAYEVALKEGQRLTFLDTPGHEAFTAMRARGAKVTDVAIIVIAADDKIMPQTREAISHAQAAEVPIIFAINKVDKEGAKPEYIKEQLAAMNFLVDDWGGKYQSQEISAKFGTNVEDLLEKVLFEAEVLELKANPKRAAQGAILEASLDKGRGYVSKVLVKTGTLKIGDAMVSGGTSGKVKAMFNERNQRVKEAGPSTPVLVLGLNGAPQAGEKFKIVESETDARDIATRRAQLDRSQEIRATRRLSLEEIGRRLALGTFKELNLIIKGDVDGSVEALKGSLLKQSVETVQVNVIHSAVGQITENDVNLATSSDAIIIGFQVRPSSKARNLAEKEGVQIKTYSIIYDAIEEIKAAIEGMLEPTKEEKNLAQIEVREVFKINRVGTIAGCFVTDGKIGRNTHIRVIRDGIVVYPLKEGVVGELSSLRRFKDDVAEVKRGFECGLTVKNFNDIKVGDVIEGYEIVEVKQTLKS